MCSTMLLDTFSLNKFYLLTSPFFIWLMMMHIRWECNESHWLWIMVNILWICFMLYCFVCALLSNNEMRWTSAIKMEIRNTECIITRFFLDRMSILWQCSILIREIIYLIRNWNKKKKLEFRKWIIRLFNVRYYNFNNVFFQIIHVLKKKIKNKSHFK